MARQLIAAMSLAVMLVATGNVAQAQDIDGNGNVDVIDIDLWNLCGLFPTDICFDQDVNLDGLICSGDRDMIVFVLAILYGDANMDGVVNGADLNIVALNWQTNVWSGWRQGDFTGDGFVDAADMNIVALNWGKSFGDPDAGRCQCGLCPGDDAH